MKRPQERYSWDAPDDYEKTVTDVDAEKERVILGQYAHLKGKPLVGMYTNKILTQAAARVKEARERVEQLEAQAAPEP